MQGLMALKSSCITSSSPVRQERRKRRSALEIRTLCMTYTETSTATEEEEDQTESESAGDTPYDTTDDRACVASSLVVLVSVSLRHVRFILTKATA